MPSPMARQKWADASDEINASMEAATASEARVRFISSPPILPLGNEYCRTLRFLFDSVVPPAAIRTSTRLLAVSMLLCKPLRL